MRDIFYFFVLIVVGLFVLIFINLDDIGADVNKLELYNNEYVVTHKLQGGYILRNYITLRKDTLSYSFLSDDIIFNKLEVGDTLNVDKLQW